MKLVVAVCVTFAGGCLWATPQSQVVQGYEGGVVLGGDGHVEGGAAHVGGGMAGLGVDLEANLRDAVRQGDPRRGTALGLGLSLRASLLGILGTDHLVDRYFDLGAAAGCGAALAFGVPTRNVDGLVSGWVGAWTELGTVPIGDGYLALTGGIRAETSAEPWTNQTQLFVGLAFRQRRTATAEDLRFRD